MKTTRTFSILFWADLARAKDNQAAIYARNTVNGKRATLSLKCKVPVTDWMPIGVERAERTKTQEHLTTI